MPNPKLDHRTHRCDFCVVGGGLSGLAAAIAAARRGTEVILVHDRPMLGGNASSEIRMWIGGARGEHNRETGIVEEMLLGNLYHNPQASWPVWDLVLYDLARREENLTLMLNCSVNDLTIRGDRIASVTGWQSTTQRWITVEADLFADCSGDSILAPLSGAEFRLGREARGEHDEDIQPPAADDQTMGLSCLIQARQHAGQVPFRPPVWARRYETCEDLPHRDHDLKRTNFWWIELGGQRDTIGETEEIRDELLAEAVGVWDHIRNRGDHGVADWALDWIGFLPGKRESRRYVGDHVLTQNDVRDGGVFEDIVAYGGWSMDDHHPAGLRYPGEPTIFHQAPSPYGIPYRCLYSRNVPNLFCAGRNISASHAALSSTRVMATCATMGQAVGTAAAIAVAENTGPRGVYENHMDRLQRDLMADDCYLPGLRRAPHELTARAALSASTGDAEPIRNGIDRTSPDGDNAWLAGPDEWLEMALPDASHVDHVRIVFDSNPSRHHTWAHLPCRYDRDAELRTPPPELVRSFRVQLPGPDGRWETAHEYMENYQRLVRVPLARRVDRVRLVIDGSWGVDRPRVFAVDLVE